MSSVKRFAVLDLVLLCLFAIVCNVIGNAQETEGSLPFITPEEWERAVAKLEDLSEKEFDIIQINFDNAKCFGDRHASYKYANLIYFYVSPKGKAILSYPADADSVLSLYTLGSNKERMTIELNFETHNCIFTDVELRQNVRAIAENLTNSDELPPNRYLCFYDNIQTTNYIVLPYITWNRFSSMCRKANISDYEEVQQSWSSYFIFGVSCLIWFTFPLVSVILPVIKASEINNINNYHAYDTPYSFSMMWKVLLYANRRRTNIDNETTLAINDDTSTNSGCWNKLKRSCVACWNKLTIAWCQHRVFEVVTEALQSVSNGIHPVARELLIVQWICVLFNLIIHHQFKKKNDPLQYLFIEESGENSVVDSWYAFLSGEVATSFILIYVIYRISKNYNSMTTDEQRSVRHLSVRTLNGENGTMESPLVNECDSVEDVHIQFQCLKIISNSLFSLRFWTAVFKKSSTCRHFKQDDCSDDYMEIPGNEDNDDCKCKCKITLYTALKTVLCPILHLFIFLINVIITVVQCFPLYHMLIHFNFVDLRHKFNESVTDYLENQRPFGRTRTAFTIGKLFMPRFVISLVLTVIVVVFVSLTFVRLIEFILQLIIITIFVGIPFYPVYAAAKTTLIVALLRVLNTFYNDWQKQLHVILSTILEETSQIRVDSVAPYENKIPKKVFMYVYTNSYYANFASFFAKITFTIILFFIAHNAFLHSGGDKEDYGTIVSAVFLFFSPEVLGSIFGSEKRKEELIKESVKQYVANNITKVTELLNVDHSVA